MLKDAADRYYFNIIVLRGMIFEAMVAAMRNYFETDENRKLYFTVWRIIIFICVFSDFVNIGKTRLECFEILL